MNVIVVGAGASGLICSGRLAELGHNVTLIDANEKVGKKIYITGKGRCNLTNAGDDFFENIVSNKKFLYSSFNYFNNMDCMAFFEKLGLKLKIERGNRVFPTSDKSSDVIKALEKYCKKFNVKVILNEKVDTIKKDKDGAFIVESCKNIYYSKAIVLATGGMSFPLTGSTGCGYKYARNFGHDIILPVPALVPIKLKDEFCKQIEGLPLKNIKLIAYSNKKMVKEFFGELLFTKDGITGPIVLSMSSYINRLLNIELYIDLKPALTIEKLLSRINREIEDTPNIQLSSLMKSYLPKNFVSVFLESISLNLDNKIGKLNEKQKLMIINNLKHFKLNYQSLYDVEKGVVTSGGVNIKEINPKTFESKIVSGLYIIGELLDLDALTGGYNLQIAWTTGYTCASLMEEK